MTHRYVTCDGVCQVLTSLLPVSSRQCSRNGAMIICCNSRIGLHVSSLGQERFLNSSLAGRQAGCWRVTG
jgi:hypothetical protein